MAAAFQITGSDQNIGPVANPVHLMGWSLRETAGAAAYVEIRVGSATGKIIGEIAFTANADRTKWFGPNGVASEGQLWVEIVSGTVAGAVWIR